jgi:hypothetical protein
MITNYSVDDIVSAFKFTSKASFHEAVRRGSFPPADFRLGKKLMWKSETLERVIEFGYANHQYNSPKSA